MGENLISLGVQNGKAFKENRRGDNPSALFCSHNKKIFIWFSNPRQEATTCELLSFSTWPVEFLYTASLLSAGGCTAW
jgi:hypothetical protein